jgi:hypothetical protein
MDNSRTISEFYLELEENERRQRSYKQQTNGSSKQPEPLLRSLLNTLRDWIAPPSPPTPLQTPLSLSDGMTILRHLLSEPTGSSESWNTLHHVLIRLPEGESLQIALDYVRSHTTHWPAALCPYTLRKNAPEKVHTLARQLELRNGIDPEDVEDVLYTIARHVNDFKLEDLSVNTEFVTTAHLRSLIEKGPCSGLKRLEIGTRDLHLHLGSLLQMPQLSGLEELVLLQSDQQLTTESLRSIARSPHLRSLKRLHLTGHLLNLESAPEPSLMSSPSFAQLETLNLHKTPVEDHASFWRHLKHLKQLGLRDLDINHDMFHALLEPERTQQLSTLDLRSSRLSFPELEQLMAAPFQALHTLFLSYRTLDPAKVELMCRANPLLKPRILALRSCELYEPSLLKLIEAPLLQQVEVLDLSKNFITLPVIRALERLVERGHLKELSISSHEISEQEAYALMGSKAMRQLEVLQVDHLRLEEPLGEALHKCYPHIISCYPWHEYSEYLIY